MSKVPEIPFLKGYEIKPQIVTAVGEVIFTDGTNVVIANRNQCEAYGYRYDNVTGTCTAFNYTPKIALNTNKQFNYVRGAANTLRSGTANTLIMGDKNTVNGLSRNNIIVGNNNEIEHSVNNANVYGTLGEATADNSIVLGGNTTDDNLGERQSIKVMYGIQTTNGTNTISYLNNTTDKLLAVPENAIMYFHADVIAVRVDGTGAGSRGDYASWVERGVIINKSGVLSIKRERDAIKNNGTVSAWQPTGIVSGTDFAMRVRGATDVTIEWCSNITFTQIKTGVSL